MTAFDHFSPDALTFFKNLKSNNTREWFAENKTTYDQVVKEPARAFAIAIEDALKDLTGQRHTAKIFRIHRDVRFSKDKTPHNTHLHMSFSNAPSNPNAPMWFFGWDTEGLTLGCGIFQYQKQALEPFRNLMTTEMGGHLNGLVKEAKASGLRVSDPALKRVPNGYDKAHPNSEALRRKGLAVWNDLGRPDLATEPGFVSRCIEGYKPLLATHRMLSEVDQKLT